MLTSFGSKFSTPHIYCREGFERVLRGLEVPHGTVAPLYVAFENGHLSGNPRLQIQLITAVLADVKWRWPWLEACAAELEFQNLVPLGWRRFLTVHPCMRRNVPSEIAIELLSVTLSKSAFSVHTWAQMTDSAVLKVSKPTLIVGGGRCEASHYMVNKHKSAMEALNSRELPPFFPMDLVMLTTMWPERSAPKPKSSTPSADIQKN